MFSGIVEEYAKVVHVVKDQENLHLTLTCSFVNELKIDQSVSHNGVCLTVVSIQDNTYTVTAMKETIERSNIGLLQVGDKVNVERSMMMNGRLDGHIVQGHVDETAECVELGYRRPVVAETINGLEGYPQYRVTNTSDGTSGRNIEEDDEYRERIRAWASKQERGTKACIEDYLNHYNGLDSYNLIPRYDGIGTLKIVCDTLESLLPSIAEDVYENCMLYTDEPPLCVAPSSAMLQNLTVYVHLRGSVRAQSVDELKQQIRGQCYTFVSGGRDMSARTRQGLGIGDDFAPSELVSYLQAQFPEVQNIRCSQQSIIVVDDTSKFEIDTVTVVIE